MWAISRTLSLILQTHNTQNHPSPSRLLFCNNTTDTLNPPSLSRLRLSKTAATASKTSSSSYSLLPNHHYTINLKTPSSFLAISAAAGGRTAGAARQKTGAASPVLGQTSPQPAGASTRTRRCLHPARRQCPASRRCARVCPILGFLQISTCRASFFLYFESSSD